MVLPWKLLSNYNVINTCFDILKQSIIIYDNLINSFDRKVCVYEVYLQQKKNIFICYIHYHIKEQTSNEKYVVTHTNL